MLQLCNKFYQDADMQEIYYKIEYGKFRYSLKSFHCSEDEQKLDKLLGLLSYISQLYQMGIIRKKELEMLRYEFQTVYEYEDIKAYFNTLDKWFQSRMITHMKFQSFREVGKMLTV
ncbi:hypothetical protein SAMN05421788_106356 [Filimonas lacunae]|uniref:Uncharacterized protein n=1 Tax=Filimonas lacunae TaxID=477680 RepID=A0A173MFM2_9BACT|nr:long-chain fatty acid--CoA ligase [Filimonas lacunae]BAV06290.1 hypothetical protein FLA_2306 [Filimonas lacunae]SIT25680.1 hypothetical protein SAMN05421788_106356 [Filimonas lacunae]